MNLAKGVEFFEDAHEYYYKGKRLSGITGLIKDKLNIKMPEAFVEERRLEGSHVHSAVKSWIDTGTLESAHPGAAWVIACFLGVRDSLHGEELVSDFKQYASSVDVIDDHGDGVVDIYDIKNGIFRRDYCAWQLSIYKYLIETYSPLKVAKCSVLCVRDKETYPIFPKPFEQVEKLLYR
jgi:hypothetical protein